MKSRRRFLVLNRGRGSAQKLAVGSMRVGLSLIELLVIIGIVGILLGLTLTAVHRARDAAYRIKCADNLKQIGVALEQYRNERGALPPGISVRNGKDPFQFMSWCTRILPFLGHAALWEQSIAAYQKEPSFLKRPPHCGTVVVQGFICPMGNRIYHGQDTGKNRAAFTYYLGAEGTHQWSRDGLLFMDSQIRAHEVTDGLSHTLLVGERPPSADGILGWWYAGWGQDQDGSAEMILGAREQAVHYSLQQCLPDANHFRQGRLSEQCDALHFWSLHLSGGHFLLADGSVQFVSYSADKILPALATRAGNEAVELP